MCSYVEERAAGSDSTGTQNARSKPCCVLDSCLPRLLQTMGLVFDKLIGGVFGNSGSASPRSRRIGAHYASNDTFAAFVLVSGFKQMNACLKVLPRKVWVTGAVTDTKIAEAPEQLLLRIREFVMDVVRAVAPQQRSNSLASETLHAAIDLFRAGYQLWCPEPELQKLLLLSLLGPNGTELSIASGYLFEAAMNCCMEAGTVLPILNYPIVGTKPGSTDDTTANIIIPDGVNEAQWARHIHALAPVSCADTGPGFMQRIIDILGGSRADHGSHDQRARRVAARVLAKVQEEIVFNIDFNRLDGDCLEEHTLFRFANPGNSASWGCGSNDAITVQVIRLTITCQ